MSDVGDAITEVRSELNDEASEILTDLCDLIDESLVSDGHSGHTLSDSPVASNIPVEMNQVTPGSTQIVAGGQTYQATHQLKFGYSATTLAITPEYKIKVLARGLVRELVFEKPAPAQGSKGPWLIYSAVLTTGFREPANV